MAATAVRMLAAGPAARCQRLSRRGLRRLIGVDGDRLGPAEGRGADQDEHQGQQDRPDGVDVGEGVEANPAHARRPSGRPIGLAAQPCDASWMVMAKSRTNRLMAISTGFMAF